MKISFNDGFFISNFSTLCLFSASKLNNLCPSSSLFIFISYSLFLLFLISILSSFMYLSALSFVGGRVQAGRVSVGWDKNRWYRNED